MELKLTGYFRIIISLLYEQNSGEIMIFRTIITIFKVLTYFRENRNFQNQSSLCRHNYVTPLPIVIILVCINRKDHNIYYGCKQVHFMKVDIMINGFSLTLVFRRHFVFCNTSPILMRQQPPPSVDVLQKCRLKNKG